MTCFFGCEQIFVSYVYQEIDIIYCIPCALFQSIWYNLIYYKKFKKIIIDDSIIIKDILLKIKWVL